MNASKSRCNDSSYPAQANRERKQCVGRDCISDVSIISANFTYSVWIISVETIEFSIRLAMTFTTSKSISNTLQLTNRRRLWLKTRFIDRYAEFWKNAGIAFFKNVQIIRRRLEKSSKEKPLNILQVLSRCFHGNAANVWANQIRRSLHILMHFEKRRRDRNRMEWRFTAIGRERGSRLKGGKAAFMDF